MRVSFATWAAVIGMAVSPALACADDTKAAKPGEAKATKSDDTKAAKPDDAKATKPADGKAAKSDDVKVPAPAKVEESLKKLVDSRKVTTLTIYNGNEKSVNFFAQSPLTNDERAMVEKENQKTTDRMPEKHRDFMGGGIVFTQLRQPAEFPVDYYWPEQATMPSPIFDRAPISQGGIYRVGGDDYGFGPLYRTETIPPTQGFNGSLANQLGMLGILEPYDGYQRNRRSTYIFIIRDFRPDWSSLGQMRGLVSDFRD
jgi:hypothetical protein